MHGILGYLALCGVIAALGVWSMNRRKSNWSNQKLALISALPVPALFSALCLFVFVRAAFTPKAACGVDACAMAMKFALVGLLWGGIGYAIGLVTATLAVRKLRP